MRRHLVDVVRKHARRQGDFRCLTLLGKRGQEVAALTYSELDRRARAIAARLQEIGGHGERAILLYPQGIDFVAAFFGCLYAGTIAVPAYMSTRSTGLERLRAIAADCEPRFFLGLSGSFPALEELLPKRAGVISLSTDDLDSTAAEDWREPAIDGETLAFLQYTSGSTADPRGVMVRHDNLLHNTAAIYRNHRDVEVAPKTVVSWLPSFHDMGLIGGLLMPILHGDPCYLMSPLAFVQRPFIWLEAISRYRGVFSGAPDFAYDLCVRRIRPEQRSELDLSSWRYAFNGAEPVRAGTLERFLEAFEPCGLHWEALHPVYGLAEATLMVGANPAADPPRILKVDAEQLAQRRIAPVEQGSPRSRALVGCGRVAQDTEIRIVDPENARPCATDEVGEIWIAGPSVASGYWRRASDETFRGRLDGDERTWLRTGDLGFLYRGEVFVTGRLKDLIILGGRNHFPQDLELTAERAHGAIRTTCAVAFSIDVDDEERLVVGVEIVGVGDDEDSREEVAEAVRAAISRHHEVTVHDIVLLPKASLPKTSSGKIRRHACRQAYLDGALGR